MPVSRRASGTLVLSLTDEGDCVFDPYMGVGSTVIAAIMHNRRGYGCEIVQEYVDIAKLGSMRWNLEHSVLARWGSRFRPSLPKGGH